MIDRDKLYQLLNASNVDQRGVRERFEALGVDGEDAAILGERLIHQAEAQGRDAGEEHIRITIFTAALELGIRVGMELERDAAFSGLSDDEQIGDVRAAVGPRAPECFSPRATASGRELSPREADVLKRCTIAQIKAAYDYLDMSDKFRVMAFDRDGNLRIDYAHEWDDGSVPRTPPTMRKLIDVDGDTEQGYVNLD